VITRDSEGPSRRPQERTGRHQGWRVRILVDTQADAAAVGRHLERFGCRVVEMRPRGLLLELPNASGRADAEAEARLYLAMWHESHPSLATGAPRAV
jgi:hypothetical protein